MSTRVNLCAGVFVAAMTVGCGPNLTAVPPGPSTGPTTLAPLLLPRLDGVWGGDLTLAAIAGGAGSARDAGAQRCAGVALSNVVGETTINTLSITQDGSDLSARLVSASTGLACTYTGKVGNGTIVLDSDSCTGDLTMRCPTGEVVDLDIVGSSITATIDAPVRVTSLSGVASHTYNVGGDPQGLVVNHTFGMTRR
jgi:hypothetical protein